MSGSPSSVPDAPTSTRRLRSRGLLVLAPALAACVVAGFAVAGPAAAVTAPGLGTSASYSVLGGQSVTNTGTTDLAGNLGVSPGTAISGFPPGIVHGVKHAADAPALQAQSDLTTAYNVAAGEAPDASVSGDLVGQTKVAGVYNSSGPLQLSGTLTLDGQGNPNSVFVFQVASTLKTASASYINMINGAQACNVYWQVGSSATLGTNSLFRGTIMALTSITVTTGTVVQGRALARNGSVTLDSDVFTSAACGTSSALTSTSTTINAAPRPATAGKHTTLTATVTGPGGTPTGTVTFFSGATPIGTVRLTATGHASLTIPSGGVGSRLISARFNGSVSARPSTSPTTRLTVHAAAAPVRPAPTATSTAVPLVANVPAAGTTTLAATGATHVLGLTSTAAALLVLGLGLLLLARAPARIRAHAKHRTGS
jgi:Ice-binding-like/Bacterial Ig-like domain (group 3)